MSIKKEKQEPYVYEYTRELREIKPIISKPTNPYEPVITPTIDRNLDISWLKAEIRRVNALLSEKPNPHTYKQNKKYLERLERKLRQCQKIKS